MFKNVKLTLRWLYKVTLSSCTLLINDSFSLSLLLYLICKKCSSKEDRCRLELYVHVHGQAIPTQLVPMNLTKRSCWFVNRRNIVKKTE